MREVDIPVFTRTTILHGPPTVSGTTELDVVHGVMATAAGIWTEVAQGTRKVGDREMDIQISQLVKLTEPVHGAQVREVGIWTVGPDTAVERWMRASPGTPAAQRTRKARDRECGRNPLEIVCGSPRWTRLTRRRRSFRR